VRPVLDLRQRALIALSGCSGRRCRAWPTIRSRMRTIRLCGCRRRPGDPSVIAK